MICHPSPLRLATDEDVPRIREILEHPNVSDTFGPIPEPSKNWHDKQAGFAWFMFEGGVFAVEVRNDWSAFVHVAALPGFRGPRVNYAFRALLDFIFENTPCPRVSGWISEDNRRARVWAQMMGGKLKMRRDGRVLYRLTREEYAASAVKV